MTMNKPDLNPTILILILLAVTAYFVLINAAKMDDTALKADLEVTVSLPEPCEIRTMQATAFNAYGWDESGIDYGPGYCIVSSESDIPLYSLLEIDQYGEGQVIATSDTLKANEIQVWYNAPSKVGVFGTQTVQVKILGKGDKPCAIP